MAELRVGMLVEWKAVSKVERTVGLKVAKMVGKLAVEMAA